MLTYDQMHTVCGVSKDLWKSLSNLRQNASVQRWESCVNLDVRVTNYTTNTTRNPWPISNEDMEKVQ